MLNVIMLSVAMLNVVMLNAVMLNAVMLSFVTPFRILSLSVSVLKFLYFVSVTPES